MPTCPSGHDSADEEFCDVCGLALDAPARPPAAVVEDDDAEVPRPPTPQRCPACDAELFGGRFCEACGHDSLAPPPNAPAAEPRSTFRPPAGPDGGAPRAAGTWTAVVSADREYYDSVMAASGPDAGGITFPQYCPDRRFTLRGKQISIGRRSVSRGIEPDIDLIGPPEDPGVSHLHGLFIAQGSGWSIVDLESSNGTTVNDEEDPLPPNTPRPLADGDQIHLGAWTTITVHSAR